MRKRAQKKRTLSSPTIVLVELGCDYCPDKELELLEILDEDQVTLSPYWGCARTVVSYLPSPEWRSPSGTVFFMGDGGGSVPEAGGGGGCGCNGGDDDE